jgi:hypothetical protein
MPEPGVSAEKRERSHVLLPDGGVDRAAAEKLLRERLGRAQDMHRAHELLRDIMKHPERYLSEEQLRMLREQGGLGDPRKLEALHPELVEALRQWAEKQKAEPPGPGGPSPEQLDGLQQLLEQQLRTNPPPRPIDPPPRGRPPTPPPVEPPSPPDVLPPPERETPFQQQMLKFAERFVDAGVLRRAGNDARRQRFQQVEEWLQLRGRTEELRAHLPELARSLRLEEILRESAWIFRTRPTLPDLGDWQGTLTLPGGGPVTIDPSSGGSLLQGLLWLLIGAALVAVFWKFLTSARRRAAAADREWSLGPWPVNPAAVATREELVRAFEYLTLLCLGPTARFWNHLHIAARLGESAARRTAAAHLANLYEQARYAPPEERLPDPDLQAARRHLCFLAGVSAA